MRLVLQVLGKLQTGFDGCQKKLLWDEEQLLSCTNRNRKQTGRSISPVSPSASTFPSTVPTGRDKCGAIGQVQMWPAESQPQHQ